MLFIAFKIWSCLFAIILDIIDFYYFGIYQAGFVINVFINTQREKFTIRNFSS